MRLMKAPEPFAVGLGFSKRMGGFWVQIGPMLLII